MPRKEGHLLVDGGISLNSAWPSDQVDAICFPFCDDLSLHILGFQPYLMVKFTFPLQDMMGTIQSFRVDICRGTGDPEHVAKGILKMTCTEAELEHK